MVATIALGDVDERLGVQRALERLADPFVDEGDGNNLRSKRTISNKARFRVVLTTGN